MSCTKVAAQREMFLGNLPELPDKEMDKLEENFYHIKEAYLSLYEANKQNGNPLTLQNYTFGNEEIFQLFDRVRSFDIL